jgi:hypothetical protein
MKIAVIVDDLDADRRRRCFWEERLDTLPAVEYELVSLLEKMDNRKFFDVYSYDVVIFNWCVLDGALMYSSDRVQKIVSFYDDHFVQFVRKGGILIMEDQPKRWRPVQEAYDILLPGEVRVIPRETQVFGSKVIVNQRLRKHPLIQNLPSTLHSAYAHPADESWFPAESTSARSIQELHPTKAYAGAFQRWRPDWLPLLYTEDETHPVMLVKTDGLGLWVATTMFLASSNIDELVESLIIGGQRNRVEIRDFHERQRKVRMMGILRIVGIFLGLATVIYFLLASQVITADIPHGSTVLANILFSLILTIVLSSITFLRKYVSSTMRAILNK